MMQRCSLLLRLVPLLLLMAPLDTSRAEILEVEGQPLGANVRRLVQAMAYLGSPFSKETAEALDRAARARDAAALQELLDPQILATVEINPELRVKAVRGPGDAFLQQHGFTPKILKVWNLGTVSHALNIESPEAGAVYAGASLNILKRQAQTELNDRENVTKSPDKFLDVALFRNSPMTPKLSGLEVEYVIALISSSEAGKREALLHFDVGQGSQDLGFRSELPVLFDVRPAVSVPLQIRDRSSGEPPVARLTFRDALGRVYPPQPKRVAPDLFFQPHIYRADGESVLLPPGTFTMTATRGPEYRTLKRSITVQPNNTDPIVITLERWIEPEQFGYYVGDHHIHGAGCSHYTSPMEGVLPEHLFRQIKGEGLNVGCALTWGPCYDFQRQFFSPVANNLSEAKTLLKYDIEVSGFGSAPLGHVCLLNLTDQTYPSSEGRSDRGWPSWTVPVMRWCRDQGGVTGYPHSALGMNAKTAANYLTARGDEDRDEHLSPNEAAALVLPEAFEDVDADSNGRLSSAELEAANERAADELPNVVIPAMDGKGAMEIFVSVPEGVCDFVSAMDTERLPEWNTWYHLMNCGFPLKLSGETDFPCMSSRRVGQGRVYVQLGQVDQLDFVHWVRGLAAGRSYVSDGFAHALEFKVAGQTAGNEAVSLDQPGPVRASAKVAFAPEIPRAVAYGTLQAEEGRRVVGDTRILHAERRLEDTVSNTPRLVELVVNGIVRASREVTANGEIHDLAFDLSLERSAWVALRSFPQLHTNPVTVHVNGQPIRASRDSARWCALSVDLLWKNRSRFIAEAERPAARAAYDRAIKRYEEIAAECPPPR